MERHPCGAKLNSTSSVEISREKSAAYSESWNIGSTLPSDDESVFAPPRKRQRIFDETPSKSITASDPISEPVIKKIPPQWKLGVETNITGYFEMTKAASYTEETNNPCSEDLDEVRTSNRDVSAPEYTLYSQGIPQHTAPSIQSCQTNSHVYNNPMEDAISPVDHIKFVPQEEDTHAQNSPVSSLKLLLEAHDAAEAFYAKLPDPLWEESFQDQNDSTGPPSEMFLEIADGMNFDAEECQYDELYEFGSSVQYRLHEEDAVETYITEGSFSDQDQVYFEEYRSEGLQDVPNFQPLIPTLHNRVSDEVDDFNENVDISRLAEGRALLLGIGNPVRSNYCIPLETETTYGLSVTEIEVCMGRDLTNHWKM